MADLAWLEARLDAPAVAAHFVGIGGAGMAPLAAMVADRGWRVSGCDLSESDVTRELAARGVGVARGHAPAHVVGQDLLIHSSAVPLDAPELAEAGRRGIPSFKRAILVGALTRRLAAICVAGTHGKTTTTAMCAVALLAAGRDPSVLVGGSVAGIGVGGRSGQGELLVVESDEYDGSFLNFQPDIAIVTNVEADHLDYYVDRAAIDAAFYRFARLAPRPERVIYCQDDPGAAAIAPAGATSYGLGEGATWRATEPRPNEVGGTDFVLRAPDRSSTPVRLALPGQHNVRNALAAIAACALVGVAPAVAVAPLASFLGAGRRFERKGEVGGVLVLDDYAHHPTEIRATLAAARAVARGRVWCVFQPHTYHRTAALFDDFATAFGEADRLLLLDVYSPAGREPVIADVSSDRLAAATGHRDARHVGRDDVARLVAEAARPGDVVITMGAGDITQLAPAILARLRDRS